MLRYFIATKLTDQKGLIMSSDNELYRSSTIQMKPVLW
jgi:hypothetical protein